MTTWRIWPDDIPEDDLTTPQPGPYTTATAFEVSVATAALAVWVFSGQGCDALPLKCGVYDLLAAELVASNLAPQWRNLAGELASPGDGWIRAELDQIVTLQPGIQYGTASYGTGNCRSYILNWFGTSDTISGPIICLWQGDASLGQACYGQVETGGPDDMIAPSFPSPSNSYWVDIEVGDVRGHVAASQALAQLAVPSVRLAGETGSRAILGGAASLSRELVSFGPLINPDHDLSGPTWASWYTTTVMYEGHGTLDMGPGGTYLSGSTENPAGQWPPAGMTENTPYRLRVTALLPPDYIVAYVAFEWTDAGGNAIGTDPNASFPPGSVGWTTLDVEGVSPPNCVGAYTIFEILSAAGHIYVGQVDVQEILLDVQGTAAISSAPAGAVTLGRIP